MDKVIKHRFWILLALVPPLVIFGYYKANGEIQAATTARTTELDKSFTDIPKGTGPNPKFVKEEFNGLDVYNKELRKLVDEQMTRVWTDQLPRMTWPEVMQTYVPKSARGTMKYRAEFPREAAFTYKAEYPHQIEKLHESIEPLKMEIDGKITGKVQFDLASIPPHYFPPMLVPSEMLWDAQEDIWLLQLLFDAVRNINRPAENAAKSAVRWVYSVNLLGGTGESILVAAGPGGGGMGMGMGREDGDETLSPASGGMGYTAATMGRIGMGGAGAVQTSVGFNPAEEFGMLTESAAPMGGAGAGMGMDADEAIAVSRGAGRGNEMNGGMGMGMGGFGGGVPIRYIKFDEAAKFRERGFYMSVLIDQKKIADFLVELSNADWPIRIVRFNVCANPGGAGRPGGGGGMLAGGMGMGMGMQGVPDTDGGGGGRNGRGGGGGNAMFSGVPPAAMGGGGMGFAAGMSPFAGGGMMRGMNADDDAGGGGLLGGGFGSMGAGGIGPQSMLTGDQIANLFTHPDLVQMDLCGVITMYNPPAGESGEGEAAAGTEAAPADGSAAPAADAAPSETDATAPAGDGTTPAADGTEPPADGTAPATDPASGFPPAEPAGEAKPADAGNGSDEPAATDPAAEPSATEPAAAEPAADAPADTAAGATEPAPDK